MDLYERLFESAPDAVLIVDVEGRITRTNAQAERLFGRLRSELIGVRMEVLIPGYRSVGVEESESAPEPWMHLFGKRGEGQDFPAGLMRLAPGPDGLSICVVRDLAGREPVRDLDDQGRSREKVARLAAIVDSAVDGIIGKDLNGIIHSWNPGAERLFGYPAAEAIGRHISLVIPPDLLHEEAEIMARIRRHENVDSYGSVRRRKDGSSMEVWLTIAPVKDALGNVIGASKIVRDVTEQRQASRRVLDALRDRELLLREIHHRVKNNLAVIGSLFYLQSTYAKDAHTTSVLRDCQDRVRSMALVHDRLYHSENLAQVDFAEYAEELSNQLIQAYVLTPGTIRLVLALEHIGLTIDQAVPCGLILNELIANALKHAFPDGRSGVITVGLAKDAPGKTTFSVSDDGVGLPDEATFEARRSLGMHLITSLGRQLDADVEFIRLDPGTRVRLTLPDGNGHQSRNTS